MSPPAALRVHLPSGGQGPTTTVLLRYAAHAAALGYRVTLGCAAGPDAVRRLLAAAGGATVADLRSPLAPDEVALVAMPRDFHLAYRALPAGASPERLVQVLTDARAADPAWRQGNGTRVLTRPAARISTSDRTARLVAPWLDPRGLHRTVRPGPDGTGAPGAPGGPAPERTALAAFLTELADRLAPFEAARQAAQAAALQSSRAERR